MHHLFPRWVRKGLETEGVSEVRTIRGIAREFGSTQGTYGAGIVGLALIGKLGKARAAELCRNMENELRRSEGGGPHTQTVCNELDLTVDDMNVLNRRHTLERSARTLADGLEKEATTNGVA